MAASDHLGQQFGDYSFKFTEGDGDKDLHRVDAIYKGKSVGFLDWHPYHREGELQHIEVTPEHRRKGVATSMWNFAKKQEDGNFLSHGRERTDEGEAWAKSTKEPMPKRIKI